MATAVQVEALWSGLTDNSGSPLAAGKVYTYYAGTSTPVSLYTASDKSTLATNPLILDGNGRAQVWGDGRYKFVVKTSADVTLYTLDNLLYGFDDSTAIWCGAAGGTGNAVTVSAPSVTQYSEGTVSFIAASTNTGPVTVNLNSLGAVALTKGANRSPLVAGDIQEGQVVSAVYEVYGGVGRFRLASYPTVADIQLSRMVTASNVAGTNVITADLTPSIYQYEVGQLVRFKAVATNSAAVTLNINSKGAKAVQWRGQALVGSEIQADAWVEVVYDGTQFQLLNPYIIATYYASGVAGSNTITATVFPPIASYAAGLRVWIKAASANTGATTISLNSLGAKDIKLNDAALVGGEIRANALIELLYDGTQFQIVSPLAGGLSRSHAPTVAQVQDGDFVWLGTTSGSANAQTASASPAITTYKTGAKFRFLAGFTNTGAATLAINGLVAKNIFNVNTSAALTTNKIIAGRLYEVLYDGTQFLLLSPSEDWISYTPSQLTQGTPISFTTNHSQYRVLRDGKTVEWIGSFNFTGAGNSAYELICALPIATNMPNYITVGSGTIYRATGTVVYVASFLINGTGYVSPHTNASSGGQLFPKNVFQIASGDSVGLTIKYTIA